MTDDTNRDYLAELNPRHRLFVIHYVRLNFNATAAAKAAGYSERSAHDRGHNLKKRPDVQAALSQLLAETVMGPEETMARLSEHARGDILDFIEADEVPDIDEEGNPINRLRFRVSLERAKTAGRTRLIRKLKQQKDGTIEVELHDQQAALNTLAKMHGLLKDTLTIHNVDYSDLTNEQLQRIADGEDPARVLGTDPGSS